MSLVEFEEWFDDEYSNYGKSYKERYDERNDMYSSQFVDERYDAFKAGQQSQQGEVNKLQTKIDAITKQRDSFIKAHHIAMNDVCENKDKIDEVNEKHSEEKRILHNVIEMNQAKIDELQARFDGALKIIDGMRHNGAYKALDILKGNKDEK